MQYAIENHSLEVLLVGAANFKMYPESNSLYDYLAYTLHQPLMNTRNE